MDRLLIREQFTTQLIIKIFILQLANRFSSVGVPVYLYEYDETNSTNSAQFPIPIGANHDDESAFVFGKVFNQTAFPQDATQRNQLFSENLIKMWSDFVYNGWDKGYILCFQGMTNWKKALVDIDILSKSL